MIVLTDANDYSQQLAFTIDEIIISDSLDFHKDVSCFGDVWRVYVTHRNVLSLHQLDLLII